MAQRMRRAGLVVACVCMCVLFGAAAEAKLYKSYDDVLKSGDKADIARMKAVLEKAGYTEERLLLDDPPSVVAWFTVPDNLPGTGPRYIALSEPEPDPPPDPPQPYPQWGGGLVTGGGYPWPEDEEDIFSWSCGTWSDDSGSVPEITVPGLTLSSYKAHLVYTFDGVASPEAESGTILVYACDLDVAGVENDNPENPGPPENDPEITPGYLVGLNGPRREVTLTTYDSEYFSSDEPDDGHAWTAGISVSSAGGNVKFWNAATGGQEVTDLSWEGNAIGGPWHGDDIPSHLYVEGIACGEVGITFECSINDHFWPEPTTSSTDKVKFTVAQLRILQSGQDITNTTHDEIVGKRIRLEAQLLPAGLHADTHTWAVPGNRVLDFLASLNSGEVRPLTDLQQANIAFCWVDGADGRTVSCTVTALGEPIVANATFNVKRPTATATVTLGPVGISGPEGEYYYGLRFGELRPPTPGFQMDCTLDPPEAFGGETCFVQVYRRHMRWDNSGSWVTETGLDPDRYPNGTPRDWRYNYVANGRVVYVDDSPAYSLGSRNRIEVRDGSAGAGGPIKMWYMFRPNVPDAIWVPLLVVNWHWSGMAHRTGVTWIEDELDPLDPPGDIVTNPTNNFPEWTSIIPSD